MNNTFKTALLVILLYSSALSANTNQVEQIPYEKINENFYVLLSDGDGSNVGVNIAENGVIVADTMLPKAKDKLLSTVKAITDKPVKFIVNTHDHMDHTGNNKPFIALGATAFTHGESNNNDLNIVTTHVVSHSPNDLLVYFPESNVLMMGDTFTNNWYPSYWAGGLKGQVEVIDKALELANKETVVVPGHGFITDIEGLKRYKTNSISWVNRIMTLHQQGLSVKKIAQDKTINQLMANFANGKRPVADLAGMIEHFINKTIEVELALNSGDN